MKTPLLSQPLVHDFADLGDVRLHYVSAGAGPAVVLLHGWPQTWYMWRKVLPGLAAHYRVIAPDLRGLGDSSRPVDGYDKKTLAQDVWRLVHDVLREERLFLVGHDWGGPTAFALAAQHRQAVRRLAIFDVPLPGDGTPVMFANRWHHGLHWELDFPEALTAGREDLYLGFFYRNWGARPDTISEEDQREYLRTYRQPGAMRAGSTSTAPPRRTSRTTRRSSRKASWRCRCCATAARRGAAAAWRRSSRGGAWRTTCAAAWPKAAATGSLRSGRTGWWSGCWSSSRKPSASRLR